MANTQPQAPQVSVEAQTQTTQPQLQPQAQPQPGQSWGRVLVAELKRIMLHTSSIVSLAIFAAITVGFAVGATAITTLAMSMAADGEDVAPTFIGFVMPMSLLSFLMSMRCVMSSARDYADGAAAATIVVVPSRMRLLTARIVVWVLTTFVVSIVSLLLVLVFHNSMIDDVTTALLEVLCGSIGTSVLVLVAFACATAIRRGALAMLAFLGLDLILPVLFSISSSFVPEAVGDLIKLIQRVLPGEAVGNIASLGMSATSDSSAWTIGMVATLAWAVFSIVVSYARFSTYSGASD